MDSDFSNTNSFEAELAERQAFSKVFPLSSDFDLEADLRRVDAAYREFKRLQRSASSQQISLPKQTWVEASLDAEIRKFVNNYHDFWRWELATPAPQLRCRVTRVTETIEFYQ